VIFQVPDAEDFCRSLAAKDVRMGALDDRRVRAVTHLDVDDAGVDRALEAARLVGAGASIAR
jgi:threonine aldolase